MATNKRFLNRSEFARQDYIRRAREVAYLQSFTYGSTNADEIRDLCPLEGLPPTTLTAVINGIPKEVTGRVPSLRPEAKGRLIAEFRVLA